MIQALLDYNEEGGDVSFEVIEEQLLIRVEGVKEDNGRVVILPKDVILVQDLDQGEGVEVGEG